MFLSSGEEKQKRARRGTRGQLRESPCAGGRVVRGKRTNEQASKQAQEQAKKQTSKQANHYVSWPGKMGEGVPVKLGASIDGGEFPNIYGVNSQKLQKALGDSRCLLELIGGSTLHRLRNFQCIFIGFLMKVKPKSRFDGGVKNHTFSLGFWP